MAGDRSVHFSERTNFGETGDGLMADVAERRRRGQPVIDLTDSNPTRCGLGLPVPVVLPPLSDAANLEYRGEPFGSRMARKAVAESYYRPRGAVVNPDYLFLTASTSEAYSYLFRLLCEPGDSVLIPEPSYPLFDMLARLNDVQLRGYSLLFHERWGIDLDALEAAITDQTRAIVIVHPNNPTGHYLRPAERAAIEDIAVCHGLALIVDEVFLDYRMELPDSHHGTLATTESSRALTFVMSGLSKVLAMPQMKVAWTVVIGPPRIREEALGRLEFIADAFLSVASPGVSALPVWLGETAGLQTSVLERIRNNLRAADAVLQTQTLVTRLPVEGGWSMVLRCPAWEPDHALARDLLGQTGVLTHPGSFFGMRDSGFLVVSLLLQHGIFIEGMTRLVRQVAHHAMTIRSGEKLVRQLQE